MSQAYFRASYRLRFSDDETPSAVIDNILGRIINQFPETKTMLWKVELDVIDGENTTTLKVLIIDKRKPGPIELAVYLALFLIGLFVLLSVAFIY